MAGDLARARTLIGGTLLLLVVVMIALAFAALLAMQSQFDAINRDVIAAVRNKEDIERLTVIARLAADQSQADARRLESLINIVFGPVVTLLGSVTGFYFGTRTKP